MKIALLAPAWFAVPPVRYGGIEWVVAILADGLVDRGHDVTLFATGDSRTKAHLATSYDDPPSYRLGMSMPDLHHALTCLERASEFDLVNDHSGPLAAALGATVHVPFCHTVHGPMTGEPARRLQPDQRDRAQRRADLAVAGSTLAAARSELACDLP